MDYLDYDDDVDNCPGGTPSALSDLANRIMPQGLHKELASLVNTGAIDPLMVCESDPLLSPVSLCFNTDDPEAWLKTLFSKDPAQIAKAKCPCRGFSYGSFTTDPYTSNRYGYSIEMPDLLTVLASRTGTPVVSLAGLWPQLLSLPVTERYSGIAQPLLHVALSNDEFSVETFDKLEKICGNADFLSIRNTRGETLFHRIASAPGSAEDQVRLDVASWMLQRRPGLVNEPDRFGWTPLDRFISLSQGAFDNSMGRLLIASGARFEKQLAPAFNLAAEIAARNDERLDKPRPRPARVLEKGL